ncbi:MAG: tetratricopeptide repeat protein [Alphaproteobacteria bacterium]
MTDTAENLYNKGDTFHADEDLENAEKFYKQALKIDPNHYLSLRWLADIYLDQEKYTKAIELFEQAKMVNDKDPDLYNDLGLCYYEDYQYKESLDNYKAGLLIKSNNETIHSNLGKALYEYHIEDKSSAKEFAKWWKDGFPDSNDAQVIASAILGENLAEQNKEYVKQIFDDFAEDFDEKLAELDYKAPELLSAIWKKHNKDKVSKILDAGCGTGLLSPHINNACDYLHGVDLSAEMLELAKSRELYCDLSASDLIEYLNNNINEFNGVIASDVLCYFGDLNEVFNKTYDTLQSGSYFAFTNEENLTNDNDFFLTPSGRYTHKQSYIESVLTNNNFEVIEINNATLRTEHGNPVKGLISIAKKP